MKQRKRSAERVLESYERTEGIPNQERSGPPDQPGQLPREIGPYSILREIGRGGMGVVYQARDTRLGRFVALKFLSQDLNRSADAKARFLSEARAASALDHPGICTIYDIGETGQSIYLAMAFYEGQTLEMILKSGPLSGERAVDVAFQAAGALAHAHEAGIVHRDIKPSNLLITSRGQLKILDFGVAKLVNSPSLTQPGILIGTPAYMSPEQILGEPVDHRTDLWSLGVVLFESLTGINPFVSIGQHPAFASVLRDPPPLRTLLPDAPDDLNKILEKALAKRPADRYQTARDLMRDLEGFRSAGGTRPAVSQENVQRTTGADLPVPLSSFVGREEELARILELVPLVRILTLTGTGGTGKTRLAIEAARRLAEDYEQVSFVPLAAVTDAESVPSTIAQTIGAVGSRDKPAFDLLRDLLRHGRRLLVLDNFEQVVDAAPFLAELLASCPELKVIVTTRTPLHISGEQELPVQPLTLPDPASLTDATEARRFPAVALFEQRAKAATVTFEIDATNIRAVAELCIRLDGLPLAIELAASRVKLFSPEAMLARLGSRLDLLKSSVRDRPARHQTLRNAIAWSYDLLDPDERTFFRRVSVFQGGFSLEAASAVLSQLTKTTLDPVDAVFALLDHSLLQQEQAGGSQTRVFMLETIREYGLEMLRESGEIDAVRRSHAEFYLELAREAEREVTGRDQQKWLETIQEEQDNLRLALAWTKEHGDSENERWLSSALWRFWLVRSYVTESFERLEDFLSSSG